MEVGRGSAPDAEGDAGTATWRTIRDHTECGVCAAFTSGRWLREPGWFHDRKQCEALRRVGGLDREPTLPPAGSCCAESRRRHLARRLGIAEICCYPVCRARARGAADLRVAVHADVRRRRGARPRGA